MSETVDHAALRERLSEVQLIDVRTDHEWEAGRIGGARHIVLNDLTENAKGIDREMPVVFYCRGDSRSAVAAQAFREAGYDAAALEGGIVGWAEAGLPLEPEDGYVTESGEAAAILKSRRRN